MLGTKEPMNRRDNCEKLREEQISNDPEISEWGNPLKKPLVSHNANQTYGGEPGELKL